MLTASLHLWCVNRSGGDLQSPAESCSRQEPNSCHSRRLLQGLLSDPRRNVFSLAALQLFAITSEVTATTLFHRIAEIFLAPKSLQPQVTSEPQTHILFFKWFFIKNSVNKNRYIFNIFQTQPHLMIKVCLTCVNPCWDRGLTCCEIRTII